MTNEIYYVALERKSLEVANVFIGSRYFGTWPEVIKRFPLDEACSMLLGNLLQCLLSRCANVLFVSVSSQPPCRPSALLFEASMERETDKMLLRTFPPGQNAPIKTLLLIHGDISSWIRWTRCSTMNRSSVVERVFLATWNSSSASRDSDSSAPPWHRLASTSLTINSNDSMWGLRPSISVRIGCHRRVYNRKQQKCLHISTPLSAITKLCWLYVC